MATIESLDLASLSNNPEDIAEALEDVLETTSGNIGSLKTAAQEAKDDIDDLKIAAQAVKDDIDALLANANTSELYRDADGPYDDGWTSSYYDSGTDAEKGIRITRWGKLYIAHLSIQKSDTSAGWTTPVTLTSSEMQLPSNTVNMGHHNKMTSSQNDTVIQCRIKTNGEVELYTRDDGGSTVTVVFGIFVGIDEAE